MVAQAVAVKHLRLNHFPTAQSQETICARAVQQIFVLPQLRQIIFGAQELLLNALQLALQAFILLQLQMQTDAAVHARRM